MGDRQDLLSFAAVDKLCHAFEASFRQGLDAKELDYLFRAETGRDTDNALTQGASEKFFKRLDANFPKAGATQESL